MAKPLTPQILQSQEGSSNDLALKGEIDTTYQTQQRDMFTSGLAASIGVNAFAVWHAIKSHANYETGKCWPGIRRLMELTGIASASVQGAIKSLEQAHLLRVSRLSKKNIYVARERMDVRVGKRIICTIAVDYIPNTMRERLAKLKEAALTGDLDSAAVVATMRPSLLVGVSLPVSWRTAFCRADTVVGLVVVARLYIAVPVSVSLVLPEKYWS